MKSTGKPVKKSQGVLMPTPVSEAESDRRLRPVLDALYSHNCKQALKLVQQAIHKRPGWPAARALRACAFMQSERLAEAEKEISEIRADLDAGRVPVDADCARKLHMYYLERRREECAGEVYEQAWKADVANFQLAEISFCLYVRGGAFPAAQKIATKLHRIASTKTQKYGLWATAALWLGVTKSYRGSAKQDGNSDSRMLKLACAMLSKALDALSITPSAEMVRFAVRVYKEGGELQRANDLISHPRLVIDEAEMLHIRTELPLSEDCCISDHCELLSKYDSDDWGHWLRYLDVVRNKPDWESIANEFVEKAVAREKEAARPKRGPFLAHLELLLRLDRMESLANMIVEYFLRFGSKTVSAYDLRPYLSFLRNTSFFDSTLDDIFAIASKQGQSHYLSKSWLCVWFNRFDDTPEALFRLYQEQISEQCDATDRQPGDDFLLLAAHKLLPHTNPVKERYANNASVLRAILILEAGLALSPYNFHFKLLLIRLYIEIGGVSRVAELWDSLEVKHVQLATLSHIVLHPLFDAGHHESCRELLGGVEGLWSECDQEIPEGVSKAFQAGSINAALDFVFFRSRLGRSLVLAESMIVEVLHELASTSGEPLGVKRALDCLSTMPRFTVEELTKSWSLVVNNDVQCYTFWEAQNYTANDRLEYMSEIDTDMGRPCASSEITVIVADLASLKALLNMADEDAASEAKPVKATGSSIQDVSNMTIGMKLPPHTSIRLKVAESLNDIKHLLLRSVPKNASQAPAGASSEPAPSHEVLQTSQKIVAELMDIVREVTGSGVELHNGVHEETNGPSADQEPDIDLGDNTATGSFSPANLRLCGRTVFDTLLVTSVALLPFSSMLLRGKKKAKKSASRGEDFGCAREAVLGYKRAVLRACSLIQSWIASCLENNLDWASSVLPEGEDAADLVPYLPEVVEHACSRVSHDTSSDVERADFCNGILSQIRASHATSCKSILETLRGITARLKMVDI